MTETEPLEDSNFGSDHNFKVSFRVEHLKEIVNKYKSDNIRFLLQGDDQAVIIVDKNESYQYISTEIRGQQLNASKKNVYWLIGDRFCCMERKKEIVSSLKGKWSVQDIYGKKANEIGRTVNTSPLFGDTHIVMFCDGKISEPEKVCDIFKSLPDDRVAIIVEKKIDKRSVEYKKLNEIAIIEEYESIVNGNSIDRTKIKKSKEQIKKITKFDGEESLLDYILFSSGYDLGVCSSEIEKARMFIGKNSFREVSIGEVSDIICSNYRADLDEFLSILMDGCVQKSLLYSEKIINEFNENPYTLFVGMIERLLICIYTKSLIDEGIDSEKVLSKAVCSRLELDGRNINQYYIQKRIEDLRDIIEKTKIEKMLNSLKCARDCISLIVNKRARSKYTIRKFSYSN